MYDRISSQLHSIADCLNTLRDIDGVDLAPVPFSREVTLQAHPRWDDDTTRQFIDAAGAAFGVTPIYELMSNGTVHYSARMGNEYTGVSVRVFGSIDEPSEHLMALLRAAPRHEVPADAAPYIAPAVDAGQLPAVAGDAGPGMAAPSAPAAPTVNGHDHEAEQ